MSKEKTCFVIMPISDHPNYAVGHFNRVYEHIIKPACEIAGFTPIRADEVVTTNYIALDIIKRIIESDMTVCDLSSQNANVMYELGIRQAFNKPVTFIKDNITKRIFDIQGFRDCEYDMTLRIDNVGLIREQLSDAILQTYNNKDSEINSLVKLLSISPAELSETTKLSIESEIILNQLNLINKRLDQFDNVSGSNITLSERINDAYNVTPENSIKLDFSGMFTLKKGDKVFHERFGYGIVLNISGSEDNKDSKIEIRFEYKGVKVLMMRFIILYKVN